MHISLIKTEKRVGEMAQQVKVLAAKPNDLSSIPGALHGERRQSKLTPDLHVCAVACTCP